MINLLHVSTVGLDFGGAQESTYLLCKYLPKNSIRNFIWSPFGGGAILDELDKKNLIESFIIESHPHSLSSFLYGNEINAVLVHSAARNPFFILTVIRYLKSFMGLPIIEVMRRALPAWGTSLGIDKIIAVSGYVASKQDLLWKDKTVVIYNSFDSDYFDNHKILGNTIQTVDLGDNKTIGYIGRLNSDDKGINDFIEVSKLINENRKDIKFLIAGEVEGTQQKKYEKELASSNVIHLGRISRNQRGSFYSKINLLLFPFIEEACPLAPLEAMYMGLPVASYNKPPVSEILSFSKNTAFLAEYGNIRQLAEKCLDLIEEGEDIGKSNNLAAKQYFTPDRMAMKYEGIIKEVLLQKKENCRYDITSEMYSHAVAIENLKGNISGVNKLLSEGCKVNPHLKLEVRKDMAKNLIITGQLLDYAKNILREINDDESMNLLKNMQDK